MPQLRILRLMGIAGVLGGVLLFIGDQLFYWGPITNLSALTTVATGQVPVETMALGQDWRLVLTAIFALIAAWLYTLSTPLLFFALRPAGKTIATISWILFAMLTIAIGVEHTVYFAIGVSAKNAYLLGGGYQAAVESTRIAREVFNFNAYLTYIPGIILTVIIGYAVFTKSTRFPKWLLLFLPTILIQTQYFVLPLLPDNIAKVILMGGYVNLSMLVFFVLFTISMWNGGKRGKDEQNQFNIA